MSRVTILASDWKADIRRFVELTEEMSQPDVAALDLQIKQKDVSRWRRGSYKEEPGAPKMAAIRRIIRDQERATPTDRKKGALEAVEHMQEALDQLRRRLGLSPAALSAKRKRQVRAARKPRKAQKKRDGKKGGAA